MIRGHCMANHTIVQHRKKSLQLSWIHNGHLALWSATTCPLGFDLLDKLFSLQYLAKNNVASVQPRSFHSRDEELRSTGRIVRYVRTGTRRRTKIGTWAPLQGKEEERDIERLSQCTYLVLGPALAMDRYIGPSCLRSKLQDNDKRTFERRITHT